VATQTAKLLYWVRSDQPGGELLKQPLQLPTILSGRGAAASQEILDSA